MKRNLTHIKDILTNSLNEFRPSSDIGMTRIWELWENAVGDAIAQNAKPSAFNNGTLIVNVSSSVWLQQLRFHQQAMQDALNLALGSNLVNKIRFTIANLHN